MLLWKLFWAGLITMILTVLWMTVALRKAGVIRSFLFRLQIHHLRAYAALREGDGQAPLALWLFILGFVLAAIGFLGQMLGW